MSGAIQIDGRYGEGGGQILRTSLALASLLRRPVEIHHIRGGRKKPGLRPQHLMGVKAMASITGSKMKGVEPGSVHLFFEPGQIKAGSYSFDVGTAGSTSLVLQTMIPALLFGKGVSRVVITGGTHVPWSPCFHYLRQVFGPALACMGNVLSLEIEHWGWYPKGGGKMKAEISPASRLCSTERAQRGELKEICVLSAVSNLPMSIGERQRDQLIRRFHSHGFKTPRVEMVNAPSQGTGTLVFLMCSFEGGTAGFTSLGQKGKRAEEVADDAFSALFQFLASDAAVDEHLADQLILYMALAKGRSSIVTERITTHLKTNMWVVEQFLPVTFRVDESKGIVSVKGVGFGPAQ
jgi:RNA 3'-terminal phosphate cyclase (ATP)